MTLSLYAHIIILKKGHNFETPMSGLEQSYDEDLLFIDI